MLTLLQRLFGDRETVAQHRPVEGSCDFRIPPAEGDLATKVDLLQRLVLDLLREVEALRLTQLDECRVKGIALKQSQYAQAYRKTALLTHDSTGLSDGVTKLLKRWGKYPDLHMGIGGSLNELGMLERFGYSEQEIKQYIQEAEDYESRT